METKTRNTVIAVSAALVVILAVVLVGQSEWFMGKFEFGGDKPAPKMEMVPKIEVPKPISPDILGPISPEIAEPFAEPFPCLYRAELAKVLYDYGLTRCISRPANTFKDVPSTMWYYIPVECAYQQGILSEMPDGLFIQNIL